jgi:hypothetical protein
MLAGCAAGPVPVPPPNDRVSIGAQARGSDLLYATTIGGKGFVFSYPAGGIVATFRVAAATAVWGACADRNGDVFITAQRSARSSFIYEYAHGGTTPIATLRDDDYVAADCSSDPMSGDLAVTSYAIGSGAKDNVAIYAHASGKPRRYFDAALDAIFCGYDDRGDLFADGEGSDQLAELAKGTRELKKIALSRQLVRPGGVEWDGRDLAIEEGGFARKFSAIDRVHLSNGGGTIVATTHLHGLANRGVTFSIAGDAIVAVGGQQDTEVGVWRYPAGGKVRKIFRASEIRGDSLYGVAISAAPRRR